VDRRDFLLLRHPMSPRTVEMSCERLHMSYLDLQAGSAPEATPIDGPSFAEPAAILPHRDIDDWLSDIEAQLKDVDVVRVVGEEWLRPTELQAHIDAVLDRLARRGVRIER
jgi:hypothetical protein